MRQSAIEWYHNEMESLRVNSEINNMDGDLFIRRKTEIFERAKEMYKEQIMDAHEEGFYSPPFRMSRRREAEQYYNDTYKPEK